ncbi:unnamed protein product [Miscanthus lutarioriparius]|uniref:SOSEKI DIX-like domain-containing protein n=1 Tax=Miscanthus lutarioriparius TaxID=422564 RepID=A0A811SKY4_9POAL|nr:unnamed protein product [Miscanthus lutarioriparius]
MDSHKGGSSGRRGRDVKRWLSELRGKDMPDNYSWSYKRKYKAGYVWQDLKDDDLITPVSDNEYVLKGCDVRGTPPPCVQAPRRTSSLGEKKRKEEEEDVTPCNDDQNGPVEVVLTTPDSNESSPKPPPPADQDSPGGCESARRSTAPFKNHQRQKHEDKEEEDEGEAAAEKTDTKAAAVEEQPQGEGAAGGVRGHAHAVGKQARRMRVARALHNMLTCARADADDAALRPLAARRQDGGGGDSPTLTCPGMEGCGLRRNRKAARPPKGGKEKQQRKRDGEKKHDSNKPATLPRCSQCGKEFKPQELHSHMQSCRGFKERMRSSTSARPSTDRRRNWPTAGHYSSESERPSSASAVFLLTES